MYGKAAIFILIPRIPRPQVLKSRVIFLHEGIRVLSTFVPQACRFVRIIFLLRSCIVLGPFDFLISSTSFIQNVYLRSGCDRKAENRSFFIDYANCQDQSCVLDSISYKSLNNMKFYPPRAATQSYWRSTHLLPCPQPSHTQQACITTLYGWPFTGKNCPQPSWQLSHKVCEKVASKGASISHSSILLVVLQNQIPAPYIH